MAKPKTMAEAKEALWQAVRKELMAPNTLHFFVGVWIGMLVMAAAMLLSGGR